MLEALYAYIAEQNLCKFGDRILLAVSGGVDSVVMAHLFSNADFECGILHCNFQLRADDADRDEAYVRSLAASLEMPVFVNHFDTEEHAREKGVSIQMAARELRYKWFEEIRTENGYDLVATAHNKNDSVESFLLNLSRGTGIRGLVGIPSKHQSIIRPIQFASRAEIEEYSNQQHIKYRVDASNQETKYQRNKVRHDVIPIMEQLNPGFIETMSSNMQRLREVEGIFRHSVEMIRKELFLGSEELITIDVQQLALLSPRSTWFYELFSPYGFTRLQCHGIEEMIHATSGKRSVSPSHQLFKDRELLMLLRTKPTAFNRYYLDSPENLSSLPFPMDLEVIERREFESIPGDPNIACLDYEKIQFPLTIRHWLHGDYFYPLGMSQIKKLSDFFVDTKVPVPEKDTVWILASGKQIVWIMGHRIDNRFKITEATSRILLLRF